MNIKEIGLQLSEELKKCYDIKRISNWAFSLYLNNLKNLDPYSEELLEYLFRMQDDPQFAYSEKDLKELSLMLIQGDKEALHKLNNKIENK